LEPTKTEKAPPPHQFIAQADWNREDFMKLLFQTLKAVMTNGVIQASKISDTVTVYEIQVPKSSPHHKDTHRIQKDFETLFHAIGKSYKHVCHVDLIPES
jgi:hypothetical protein